MSKNNTPEKNDTSNCSKEMILWVEQTIDWIDSQLKPNVNVETLVEQVIKNEILPLSWRLECLQQLINFVSRSDRTDKQFLFNRLLVLFIINIVKPADTQQTAYKDSFDYLSELINLGTNDKNSLSLTVDLNIILYFSSIILKTIYNKMSRSKNKQFEISFLACKTINKMLLEKKTFFDLTIPSFMACLHEKMEGSKSSNPYHDYYYNYMNLLHTIQKYLPQRDESKANSKTTLTKIHLLYYFFASLNLTPDLMQEILLLSIKKPNEEDKNSSEISRFLHKPRFIFHKQNTYENTSIRILTAFYILFNFDLHALPKELKSIIKENTEIEEKDFEVQKNFLKKYLESLSFFEKKQFKPFSYYWLTKLLSSNSAYGLICNLKQEMIEVYRAWLIKDSSYPARKSDFELNLTLLFIEKIFPRNELKSKTENKTNDLHHILYLLSIDKQNEKMSNKEKEQMRQDNNDMLKFFNNFLFEKRGRQFQLPFNSVLKNIKKITKKYNEFYGKLFHEKSALDPKIFPFLKKMLRTELFNFFKTFSSEVVITDINKERADTLNQQLKKLYHTLYPEEKPSQNQRSFNEITCPSQKKESSKNNLFKSQDFHFNQFNEKSNYKETQQALKKFYNQL